jgi:hypothetical protein
MVRFVKILSVLSVLLPIRQWLFRICSSEMLTLRNFFTFQVNIVPTSWDFTYHVFFFYNVFLYVQVRFIFTLPLFASNIRWIFRLNWPSSSAQVNLTRQLLLPCVLFKLILRYNHVLVRFVVLLIEFSCFLYGSLVHFSFIWIRTSLHGGWPHCWNALHSLQYFTVSLSFLPA